MRAQRLEKKLAKQRVEATKKLDTYGRAQLISEEFALASYGPCVFASPVAGTYLGKVPNGQCRSYFGATNHTAKRRRPH